MYCVWQVVKIPTIISNNYVHLEICLSRYTLWRPTWRYSSTHSNARHQIRYSDSRPGRFIAFYCKTQMMRPINSLESLGKKKSIYLAVAKNCTINALSWLPHSPVTLTDRTIAVPNFIYKNYFYFMIEEWEIIRRNPQSYNPPSSPQPIHLQQHFCHYV